MAMVGDAISHAVLPGIVIAFLLTGSRESFSMILGAFVFGVFTTFLIQYLHEKGKLQTDASIGVSFTWLFAVGIILLTFYAGKVDLDQDCVLHGEIAYVPIDLWITDSGVNLGPRSLYITGIVLLLNIVLIRVFYKELFITTFNPEFAASIGISVSLFHYMLMGAVSITTVASFEVVGAILVVALLIAPPATAYLLTDSFKRMLAITTLLGVIISILGYLLAAWMDGSIAGAMATVAGIIFGLVFLFSPTHGYFYQRRKGQVEAKAEVF